MSTIARALGLKSFPGRVRTWDQSLCYQDRSAEWCLTPAGARAFIATTRKEVPNWLIRELGVNEVQTTRIVPIETSTITAISKALKRYDPRTQVPCGRYRIDCVLKAESGKLVAVECDEKGHSDRPAEYEVARERYLQTKGYHLFRYNPDVGGFDIFETIGELITLLATI